MIESNNYKVKSPVVFIIFNRPDVTQRVFSAIAKARPKKLLVIADGARTNYPDDKQNCKDTRDIIESVDWPCNVLTHYSNINNGCKNQISTGLDWAFTQVKEAIILEDDCLPDISFFRFCDELLEKYRNNGRISMISGDNFQFGKQQPKNSYYFSKYTHIWGWATWSKSWNNYDQHMYSWPKLRKTNWLRNILPNKLSIWYWSHIFNSALKNNSWAYIWTFTCWNHGKVSIIPTVNLISNIGFNKDATHTTKKDKYSEMKSHTMIFPLTHPHDIEVDQKADNITEKEMFSGSVLFRKIKNIFNGGRLS